MDDIPVSALPRWPLFSPGCADPPLWQGDSPPLGWPTQGLWESSWASAAHSQTLACCWAAELSRTQGASLWLHIHQGVGIPAQVFRRHGLDVRDSYICPLTFLVTSHQELDLWYIIKSGDNEWQQGVKWWHRDCRPLMHVPFMVPLVSNWKAISLFYIRTHSPGTTHQLSGLRWRSPVLLSRRIFSSHL